jgi:hypothetical protein
MTHSTVNTYLKLIFDYLILFHGTERFVQGNSIHSLEERPFDLIDYQKSELPY